MLAGEVMDSTAQRLGQLVQQLAGHKVLVIGDLFLDEYVFGRATRLSREAPIPVLEFVRRTFVPGGAANPACNICALEGKATAVGLIGHDQNGVQLLSELQNAGIYTTGVVVDASRPTTTKTRVIAESSLRFPQQLARIDHLGRGPLSNPIETELVARAQALLPTVEAVLVSDYQTGAVSRTLVQTILSSARAQGKLCTVDAQGSFDKYQDFDLVKGNRQEIEAAIGCPLQEEIDYQRAGESLLQDLNVGAVLITRGSEGLSCISRAEGYMHLPAANRTEVFDVTGAGDTVIAVATLALLAGANTLEAACLANHAAGLVVRKLGNAVVTSDELSQAVQSGWAGDVIYAQLGC